MPPLVRRKGRPLEAQSAYCEKGLSLRLAEVRDPRYTKVR
jgi:hypothetical protein